MKNEKVKAYHFTSTTLRDGTPIPKKKTWLHYAGDVVICKSGLHASLDPFDALQYAPGPYLHLVECKDIITEHEDKFVCRSRKILKTIDATDLLRKFACKCALDVAHLWDCPPIVLMYLKTQNESFRDAAQTAARETARAAAWTAAQTAARETARAAAWTAAQTAARGAAQTAARETARGAAQTAAWYAAWDAAQTAAWGAAQTAAWYAAWDAAQAAQRQHFKFLVDRFFDETN